MKQKGIAQIFIIILLLILIGGVLYLGLPKVNTSIVQTPTPVPLSTPDVTANWKTFTNTKYRYQFKYPPNYVVGQNGASASNPEIVEDISAYDASAADNTRAPRFAITVTTSAQGSLQEQANAHYNSNANYSIADLQRASSDIGFQLQNNKPITNISPIIFLGKNAYTFTINGSSVDDKAGSYLTSLLIHKYIWVQDGDNIFLITLDNVDLTNQILSTFNFLQ